VCLGDEDPQEFAALEAALLSELAPDGALQSLLARRIARAAWRLERAERIEAELFEVHVDRDANLGPARFRDAKLGLALIRDCNGALRKTHRTRSPRESWRNRACADAGRPPSARGDAKMRHGGAEMRHSCAHAPLMRHSCAVPASPPASSFGADAALRHRPAARSGGRGR
jgi:hypothetical protein